MHLSNQKFLEIIENTPLVSIDLIIKNKLDQVLLGLRKNRPARDYWFVPGGRIKKNETVQNAFLRILKAETGINNNLLSKRFLGIYDHIYRDNFAGVDGINTHYVVIAYEITILDDISLRADDQHSQFKWWKIEDILKEESIHPNTKNYFK